MAPDDAQLLVCHGQPYIFNHKMQFFYPFGNCSPLYLLKDLPRPVPGASTGSSSSGRAEASLLLLGCGDLRDLFYTLALEDSAGCLGDFSLHAVAVDNEPAVFSRALVLLQLLLDRDGSVQDWWCIWYHHVLTPAQLGLVREAAARLIQALQTPEAWKTTPLGRVVSFASPAMLATMRGLLSCYVEGALPSTAVFKKMRLDTFNRVGVSESRGFTLRAVHSAAAPEVHKHKTELEGAREAYWQSGEIPLLTGGNEGDDRVANPLMFFAGGRDARQYLVHYEAFPLEAYNLDRAYLTLSGPRDARAWVDRATACAFQDFEAWTGALCRTLTSHQHEGKPSPLRLTLVTADAVHFSETLAVAVSTLPADARVSSALPVGMLSPLVLDMAVLPRAFDTIHCSNLADHVGTVNLLLPLSSLLRPRSYASILTAYMATHISGHSVRELAKAVTGLDASTACLFLDLVPTEWVVGGSVYNNEACIRFHQALTSRDHMVALQLVLAWRPASGLVSGLDDVSLGPAIDATKGLAMSPADFAACALPAVKVCLLHYDFSSAMPDLNAGKAAAEGLLRSRVWPRHTPVTWLKLLASARKRLKFTSEHFMAAMDSFLLCSGIIMATNLQQEMYVWAHLLGLFSTEILTKDGYVGAHMLPPGERSLALVTPGAPTLCRVVLLVPRRVLQTATTGKGSETTPPLEGFMGTRMVDNRYSAITCACVSVTRGKAPVNEHDAADDWLCLRKGDLYVREARWEEDETAELLVSWLAPTFSLALAPPHELKLAVRVTNTVSTTMLTSRLGPLLEVFGAPLSNQAQTAVIFASSSCVPSWLTKTVIDTTPIRSIPSPRLPQGVRCQQPKIRASASAGWEVCLHMELTGEEEKAMLTSCEAPSLEVCDMGPGVVMLVVEGVVLPLCLPFPVDAAKSSLQFSRKRFVLEVTLPARRKPRPDDIVLVRRYPSEHGRPARLWSPLFSRVALEWMPLLDAVGSSTVLNALVSGMAMSEEEVAKRAGPVGQRPVLVEFKDSMHSLFGRSMGQTPPGTPVPSLKKMVFCLALPPNDVNMIIRVNGLRLDPTNASVLLDCCVCPLTFDAIMPVGHAQQRHTDAMLTLVTAAELLLWKRVVALGVERVRQWQHKRSCPVLRRSNSWPPPMWDLEGYHALCNCGRGKDLPQDFLDLLPSDATCFFYRAAIPPVLPPCQTIPHESTSSSTSSRSAGPAGGPGLEQFMGMFERMGCGDRLEELFKMASEAEGGPDVQAMREHLLQMRGGAASSPPQPPASGGPVRPPEPPSVDRRHACGKCGAFSGEGDLKRCGRCQRVWYCGQACQRADWAKHKKMCVAPK